MITSGYYQCQVERTLCVKSANKTAILIVYVDDIIITRYYPWETLNLKKMLATEFEIEDLAV